MRAHWKRIWKYTSNKRLPLEWESMKKWWTYRSSIPVSHMVVFSQCREDLHRHSSIVREQHSLFSSTTIHEAFKLHGILTHCYRITLDPTLSFIRHVCAASLAPSIVSVCLLLTNDKGNFQSAYDGFSSNVQSLWGVIAILIYPNGCNLSYSYQKNILIDEKLQLISHSEKIIRKNWV